MNISVIYTDSLNHNCISSNYSYICIHIYIPNTHIFVLHTLSHWSIGNMFHVIPTLFCYIVKGHQSKDQRL